jgi:hypothetical protein
MFVINGPCRHYTRIEAQVQWWMSRVPVLQEVNDVATSDAKIISSGTSANHHWGISKRGIVLSLTIIQCSPATTLLHIVHLLGMV